MIRPPATAAGFVLAGGASRRMGTDKALLPAPSGGTLLEFACRALASAAHLVRVVAPAGRYESLGLDILPDRWPGEGPLGGLLTALHASASDWNLVAAVDMPSLDPATLSALLDAALQAPPETLCLVPVLPDGRRQPLCAAWRRAAAEILQPRFDAGLRRMMDALDLVAAQPWPAPATPFRNANTPEQWEALR